MNIRANMPAPARFAFRDGVAVITGAAGGIGGALAIALAKRGCHLALVDRQPLGPVAKSAAAAGVRVSEHVFDIGDEAAIADLPDVVLREHERVTLLINNAGVALAGSFEQIILEDFEWLMTVNFWGTVRMTKAFLPALKRQEAAQIVNLSSIFGIFAPPGQCAYAASKFAVRGFSEALRHELEAEGSPVRVSLVHPGGVRTSIARNARLSPGMDRERAAERIGEFEKRLKLQPEKAAARIVQGIERREPRILVGSDAVLLDKLQRLLPVRYWGLIRGRMTP
ncbi:MAG: SDR family NAD(P)-dependent oxidoreductase [Acidobacteriaceae bacterium]|nr:SDR family NAD(P)-dependent oxidoreductase [Acidobacteriaceae bacterium]